MPKSSTKIGMPCSCRYVNLSSEPAGSSMIALSKISSSSMPGPMTHLWPSSLIFFQEPEIAQVARREVHGDRNLYSNLMAGVTLVQSSRRCCPTPRIVTRKYGLTKLADATTCKHCDEESDDKHRPTRNPW